MDKSDDIDVSIVDLTAIATNTIQKKYQKSDLDDISHKPDDDDNDDDDDDDNDDDGDIK